MTTLTRGASSETLSTHAFTSVHHLVPLAFDVREHRVGLMGEPALADEADRLGHRAADRVAGADRGDGEGSDHHVILPSPRRPVPACAPRYARCVAFDEELADRIRELMARERGVTERRMFGGLAFLVGGHMAVSASGQGGLLVRVDPDQTERLVGREHVRRFEMRGRSMDGWLRVDDAGSGRSGSSRDGSRAVSRPRVRCPRSADHGG